MGIEQARAHLHRYGKGAEIVELASSSATVALAAQALGTTEGQIAKSLTFEGTGGVVLVVTAGDTKVDNAKFRQEFGTKAVMLSPEDVLARVGHPVGGVCPFGVVGGVDVYLDVSLRRFNRVYPACGSHNSAIGLTCDELAVVSEAKGWIDVCREKLPGPL